MRPIYGCPEKIRESLATPTATFPEIVNGRLLWSTVWKRIQNLNFVALPVPGIIGVIYKFGKFLDTPMLPFLKNFNGLLFGWTTWMYRPNLKSVALPVPSVVVLGLGPWPWAVLEDKSWVLGLGLGLVGQVLGLEGKSLVLAVRSFASWPCDLSD